MSDQTVPGKLSELCDELEEIVSNTHSESLLSVLEKRASSVEFARRDEFETALLTLAQKSNFAPIRPILYETMVSLRPIWSKSQPKMKLSLKFWQAIETDDLNKALHIFRELKGQGLDHLETTRVAPGELVPVASGNEGSLILFHENVLSLYNPQLKIVRKISMPKSMRIMDILPISSAHSFQSGEASEQTDLMDKVWLLIENGQGKRSVFSIDIADLPTIRIDPGLLEQHSLKLTGSMDTPPLGISYYRGQILLVFKNSVFYYKRKKGWVEWYNSLKAEIIAYESTKKGFWVGQSDCRIYILKEFDRIGIRETFADHNEEIRRIRRTEDFVIAFGSHCLCVSDFIGNLVLGPLKMDCEIIDATILDNNSLIIHLSNGMMVSRELKQGNIRWQLNLNDNYSSILSLQNYIYCTKNNGTVMRFENPSLSPMVTELEHKKIFVDYDKSEIEEGSPISFLSEFIGRAQLLEKIKSTRNSHFLIFSEPRVGKTSLLNVLRDTLAESSKCCIINIRQLLAENPSYSQFENQFREKCMEQHFLNEPNLLVRDDHQSFRAIINKIRGSKSFCVFCLDDFTIPDTFPEKDKEKFKVFLRSLIVHPNARIIMTCSLVNKASINAYFSKFRDYLKRRRLFQHQIPLFSMIEIKNAIRNNISKDSEIVDGIYSYTGGYPHLSHYYDNWDVKNSSLDVKSKLIAQKYTEKIFDYFRDLSADAYLLLATCLRNELIGEKNNYYTFYQNFPFLKICLPRPSLEDVLDEIDCYGDEFSSIVEPEFFQITRKKEVLLFQEASRHISWLNDFSILYNFTSSPSFSRAHSVAKTFINLTESALHQQNKVFESITNKYRKEFYLNKLTDAGRDKLDIPLAAFIVIPLHKWEGSSHRGQFADLYTSLRENASKTIESSKSIVTQKFYILLFELHGVDKQKIKNDLIGYERISVIDASMMKNIIMNESPRAKASEYIFDQLSIKERSPYTTSGAVPDELFFGREMEIALIRGLPENIGIFGTRTIGKTSLLRKLYTEVKSLPKWVVYTMDCGKIESEQVLLKNLADRMEVPFEKISDMGKFRRYLTHQAELSNKQYLFLLDEVDRLVQYDMTHDEVIFKTLNRLSTEIMKNGGYAARFILFGFHEMFEQMKNPNSRLYNFMVFLPLRSLDDASALALVTNPIEKIRVNWNDKSDASYLVECCSCHPRLLQSACHSLLSILDNKKRNKDVIESDDVNKALISAEFREMCMRFYRNTGTEDEKRKNWLSRLRSKMHLDDNYSNGGMKGEIFWNDLHRITILSAIRLLQEENNERFTIIDIQAELESHGIDISPNTMRTILDHLCLSGNFKLKNQYTLIRKESDNTNKVNLEVEYGKPDFFSPENALPKFVYEFGVQIFPKLLVSHFGGIEQCKNELKKLIEKKDWEDWLRRY